LQDVLQMECLSRNSALLEITTKELRGLIYIYEGQIIHAEAGDRHGAEAFNFLMGLTGGEFAQKPFVNPPERTISDSWEFLLMEAARKHDEASGPNDGPAPERPVAPQFRSPHTQPAPVTEPRQSSPNGAPTMLPPRRQVVPAPSETHFFTRPAGPNAVDTHRPEVAEFIVFSSQGDLIYEWQCHDVNARVNFLEFLSQKARLLCQGLPMGHFERFEVYGSRSRIITQLENDHAVFVRTNVVTDSAVPGDHS